MTRPITTQHWLLAAVLVAWTAGGLGAAPALADGSTFTGAGFVESEGGNFWYSHAIAADARHVTGGVVVRYATPNRDGLDTVITDVRDVEIVREGEVVASGESQVTFPDGSFEARVPTMVHATAYEYGLILALSDGRIVDSGGSVVLGGNNPPAELEWGTRELAWFAGIGVQSATGDAFAIGAVVEDSDPGGLKVKGRAYGRVAAAFDSNRSVVLVDAVPAIGEAIVHRDKFKLEVSGPAMVNSPDGSCEGQFEFAAEVGGDESRATLEGASPCAEIDHHGAIPIYLWGKTSFG